MERIATGDSQAFTQLFLNTAQLLHQYLIRVTGDRKISDDILVKTYQEAWHSTGQYSQKLNPVKWLMIMARKTALVDSQAEPEATGQYASESVDVGVLDRQKAFVKVMGLLSPQVREPLALVLLQGYTYHAMSEVLGNSIESVKNEVFEAKLALKEALKQFGIKKHEVSKSNILRELIPLYINGALAGKHKKAFEKSLKNDQFLKQEYMEFYEIEAYFDQLEIVSQQHLEQLFNNVKNSIEDLVEEQEIPQKNVASGDLKADFLHQLLSSARIGWGLAILQFAILAIVLIFVVPQYSNQVQAKLNTAQLLQQQAKGKKINVVFQGDASQQQISDLLRSLGAQMHSGPTDIGLYTITVKGDNAALSQALSVLRNSDHVVLADPAF